MGYAATGAAAQSLASSSQMRPMGYDATGAAAQSLASSSQMRPMDYAATGATAQSSAIPSFVGCRYNLRCNKKTCPFRHATPNGLSPAADTTSTLPSVTCGESKKKRGKSSLFLINLF
jgi:hypothetical protein